MTNEFKLFDMKDARLELVNHDRQWVEKHRRVLCVCSAGMLRSATMAWVLSNSPYNFNNSQYNYNSTNGVYDNNGNRIGYETQSPSGVTNIFDNNGNRIGYSPAKR